MDFGFLVEKFDLLLQLAAPSWADRAISLPGQESAISPGSRLLF
jgi:hypothetical protein